MRRSSGGRSNNIDALDARAVYKDVPRRAARIIASLIAAWPVFRVSRDYLVVFTAREVNLDRPNGRRFRHT